MNEATYITGVVIANGVPDSDGDCLDKTDIKKIFTKYLDRATDVMHTRIKNEGVEVLANWITESDTELNGKTVPSGSWMATFAVTNEELLSSIRDGSLSGLSLGSVSEDAMTKKYWFINKSIHYQDLDDMEEVIPLFISFVDKGANQYGLEIMDYNVYINKNDKNGEKMTNEEKIEEPMIPLSALDKLRDIFSINKKDTGKKEESKTDKEETDEKASENEDISNKELLEQLPGAIVKAFVEASKESEPTPQNEVDINKSDKDDDEGDDEDKTDSEKAEKEESEEEDEKEEEKKEDVEINKRQTSMTDVVVDTTSSSDFYERTGRDHLGRKIRK